MEKNIPGLKKMYGLHLAKLRKDKPSMDKAISDLAFWSVRYRELVTEGDTMNPGEGVYGNILEAYARREALKQYIKELQNDIRSKSPN